MSESHVPAAILDRWSGTMILDGECMVSGDLLGPFTPVSDSVDILTKLPKDYSIKIEHDVFALKDFRKCDGQLHFTIG